MVVFSKEMYEKNYTQKCSFKDYLVREKKYGTSDKILGYFKCKIIIIQ